MQDCGIIRTHYDNGNIEEEYFQINGKKHGIYTLYNHTSNDDIIRRIEYVDGKKHGKYMEYTRNCKDIYYICYYNNNIKVGEATFYHDNGNIDNICTYENGKISGMRYWYYENCEDLLNNNSTPHIKKSCNHVNGIRQGECRIYNPDGSIKSIWIYVDDEIIN